MLARIASLARAVSARWRQHGNRWQSFPSVATAALEEHRPDQFFDDQELFEWLGQTKRIPEQHDPLASFGQPPITLFNNGEFLVEVYFWVEPEITIHDHGFSGAFINLRGRSLHCQYDFDVDESPQPSVKVGKLALQKLETLQPGTVRPILGGRRFIHRVWHITRPTVTMVVRTFTLGNGVRTQFMYSGTRLATQTQSPHLFLKRSQLMSYLIKMEAPDRDRRIEEMIVESDPWTCFSLLQQYFFEKRTRMLSDLSAFDALLQRVKKRHGAWTECFGETLRAGDVLRMVRWDRVNDERDRFFAAAILTLDKRADIDALLRQRFPEVPPNVVLKEGLIGLRQSDALSLAFRPEHLEILGHMIDGASLDQIGEAMAGEYELGVDQLERFRAQLAEVPFLRPLFS
jgi:hypothetical protein